MATETRAAPLGEARSATTAGGGTALTATATRIPLLRNTKFIEMIPRAFAGSNVVQYNFNPYLIILKTTDLLAAEANITDYSDNAQDGSTSTDVTLSSLGTLAQLDAVYVGSWTPFSGVAIDVDAANSNASVLTVTYWKSDSTWATTSATDGTDNGGASMGVDGNVTWTVPTDWQMASLQEAVPATAAKNLGVLTAPQFWTRWVFSAALDSSTTQNSWLAINRDPSYAEMAAGQSREQGITVGPGGFYSIQAKTDTGAASLIVNCFTLMPPARF